MPRARVELEFERPRLEARRFHLRSPEGFDYHQDADALAAVFFAIGATQVDAGPERVWHVVFTRDGRKTEDLEQLVMNAARLLPMYRPAAQRMADARASLVLAERVGWPRPVEPSYQRMSRGFDEARQRLLAAMEKAGVHHLPGPSADECPFCGLPTARHGAIGSSGSGRTAEDERRAEP